MQGDWYSEAERQYNAARVEAQKGNAAKAGIHLQFASVASTLALHTELIKNTEILERSIL